MLKTEEDRSRRKSWPRLTRDTAQAVTRLVCLMTFTCVVKCGYTPNSLHLHPLTSLNRTTAFLLFPAAKDYPQNDNIFNQMKVVIK